MLLRELMHTVFEKGSGIEPRIQFVRECVTEARMVKKRKGVPAHCQVTFATTEMTPNSLIGPERDAYVGVIVWVPKTDYERLANS